MPPCLLYTSDLARLYLEKEGFRVQTVENGALALAQARRDPPTLLILDLMMPEMDGWEAVSYTHLDVYKRQGQGLFGGTIPGLDDLPEMMKTGMTVLDDLQEMSRKGRLP